MIGIAGSLARKVNHVSILRRFSTFGVKTARQLSVVSMAGGTLNTGHDT